VLWKETAFPRWRATDSLWNRYVVSMVSSVTAVIRRPSSCTNSTARLFQVPAVCMATGTKMWLLVSCLYLVSLLEAALSAAAPAVVAVSARCESAYVSGTVTSHANGLPFAHGSSVTPSGRMPSSRLKPGGSFTAGTCALFKDRHKMSLS